MDRTTLRAEAHRVLAEVVGATTVGRLCPRCGSGAHGAPYVVGTDGPAPWVSVSHTEGLSAVAWSYAGPVGIDVEADGPALDGIDRQEWTLAEATFKAGGEAPVTVLALPQGHVGAIAGTDVRWRLVRPADPAATPDPARRRTPR